MRPTNPTLNAEKESTASEATLKNPARDYLGPLLHVVQKTAAANEDGKSSGLVKALPRRTRDPPNTTYFISMLKQIVLKYCGIRKAQPERRLLLHGVAKHGGRFHQGTTSRSKVKDTSREQKLSPKNDVIKSYPRRNWTRKPSYFSRGGPNVAAMK